MRAAGWREFLRTVTSTPLRTGASPWVRFAKLPTEMLPRQPPWRLEVRSRDGLQVGSAMVDSITGVYDEGVRVDLEGAGRIRVDVVDDSGAPVKGASIAPFDGGLSVRCRK